MLMEQKITISNEYASPQMRVVLVTPARCIAGSDNLSNMTKNSIYEEDF